MVLAQYYNLVRYGRAGYTYIMKNMQQNARLLAERLQAIGRFELIGAEEEQLPLVAFRLAADDGYDEFDLSWQLSAERGWMVPGLHPSAERPGRHDHAGPGQGDPEPRTRRDPRPRHRRSLHHPRRARAAPTNPNDRRSSSAPDTER